MRPSEEIFLLILIKMFFLCRYVKTTANATVDHLSKYLALRVALEDGGADGETEDKGRDEGGGGEGSSLSNVSEKQYTIYILTRGGQFSVSNATNTVFKPITSWNSFKGHFGKSCFLLKST